MRKQGLAGKEISQVFFSKSEVKMLGSVLEILSALGVLSAIQFVAVAVAAIFIYRYFTDRG